MMTFNAIFLEKHENGYFSCNIQSIPQAQLTQQSGDTLVQIHYSSLNYKDALALTNKGPVVRLWPMVAGIDGVGTVVSCKTGKYNIGDKVILNGWGCGETHWGCLSQYAYLHSDWLIPLPTSFTPYQSMAVGTAGYTAALCVQRILAFGIKPEQGPVLVTGASGGVGSYAVALLAKLGYQVTASSSKKSCRSYLSQLGATNVMDSRQLKEAGKPLQKEQWAAVVDVIGSHTLANVCAQTQYGGIVTCCGLAQGMDLPATVAPFILRGVTLAGIDSVMAPYDKRIKAWSLLSQYLDHSLLEQIAKKITLNECKDMAEQIIAGQITGRVVVDVNH
jgi:acrylyl-CoA reductase (NADPH)